MHASNPIQKNHVTVTGNLGSAETMILAHGFGTDQTAWGSVAASFAQDYRLILYDNVGGGRSDPDAYSPNRYDNLLAYAHDLLDICAALDVRDAVLVGHSMSGMIGVLAAIEAPYRFSRLVLVGASPRYVNDADYHGGFEQSDLDAVYRQIKNNYYAWASGFAPLAMGSPDRPHLGDDFAASLQALRPDIALAVFRAIMQVDHRRDLARLNKPTLLIQTRQDIAVTMAAAEYMHREIRGSQLVVANAAGHLPHISAAEEVIAAIRTFLSR